MALDPQTFIQNQKALAQSYIDSGLNKANDITNGYIGEYKNPLGVVDTRTFVAKELPFPIDISNYEFNTYTAPAKDTTAMPVYQPPNSKFPTLAPLADVANIAKPLFPDSPAKSVESAIAGLFKQVAPSSNTPVWAVTVPNTEADKLLGEMDSVILPKVMQFDFPQLAALSLSPQPSITIPSYDTPLQPNIPGDPLDYAAVIKTNYATMSVSMQAFVDDRVATWISNYAPEYPLMAAQLAKKIEDALNGTVLPDQIEAAMINRARGRVARDYNATEQEIELRFKRSGGIEPPGLKVAALLTNQWLANDSLANQSTDIYISRRQTEVQHLQFIMGLANSNIQSIRGLAIQWAQSVATQMQQALNYSTEIGKMAIQVYDHLIAKANLTIAIMGELRQQYDVRLKAALSNLDADKIELETARLEKDVDMMQVQIISEKIKAQELTISQYTAIVDAISRKATIEELKLKTYSTQAQVFDTQIKAQIATFDVYKASLQGDQAKLDGQLGLIKAYESELEAIKLELEANIKSTESTIASNDAKIKTFEAEAEVFKLDLETALKTFIEQVEVKKLAQEIYKTEVGASVDTFNASLETQKLIIRTLLEQFSTQLKNYEVNAQMKMQMIQGNLGAAEHKAAIYGSASEALASSNFSLASSVITGT
jgi:hypothetical protein